jgi:hypothetical protein
VKAFKNLPMSLGVLRAGIKDADVHRSKWESLKRLLPRPDQDLNIISKPDLNISSIVIAVAVAVVVYILIAVIIV